MSKHEDNTEFESTSQASEHEDPASAPGAAADAPQSTPTRPTLNTGKTLDLMAMRLTPGYAKSTVTVREQTTVPVDKPSKHAFFRVNCDLKVDVSLFKYEVDGFWYLLTPDVVASMTVDAAKPCTLYLWMTRDGTYGVWPGGLPLDDGTDYVAWQSIHTVCCEAMKTWVRHAWNKSAGSYDVIKFRGAAGPGAPQWPEATLDEIVTKAFKGRVIDSIDHPVLRRLRGED
jgi:hypothetical protein